MGSNQSIENTDVLVSERLGSFYHDEDNPRQASWNSKGKLNRDFGSNVSLSVYSSHSSGTSEPWGWFTEDVEYRALGKGVSHIAAKQAALQVAEEEKAKAEMIADAKNYSGCVKTSLHNKREERDFSLRHTLSLPSAQTPPPQYVLESSIDFQHLWYSTAGRRPKQPDAEREYFHKLWSENFRNSEVNYESTNSPSSAITDAILPPSVNLTSGDTECEPKLNLETGLQVLYTAFHHNSYSVSKSFVHDELAAMSLSIPKFRVVRDEDELYAEFFIEISVCAQGASSAVLFGSWRRHSQFLALARRLQNIQRVSQAIEFETKKEKETKNKKRSKKSDRMERYDADDMLGDDRVFENSLISWKCVLSRQQWFRCLDREYLLVKCFLLERFMHDTLFESSSSLLLRRRSS